MYVKKIKYTDFDGNERTETHYFHLNMPEVLELQASYPGGLEKKLQTVIDEKDPMKILTVFKDLIRMSYGEKSPDGKRLIKSKELFESFEQSGAYETLYMELMGDAKEAAKFANEIMPKRVHEEAAKIDKLPVLTQE